MKNKEKWKPSKYLYQNSRLYASKNKQELGYASYLIAQLVADKYSELLPKYAHGKLLDLGCGKIPLYLAYKDYIEENICVDWENTLHKNDNLDFSMDITKPLPFRDSEFQTIICTDVLEHIFEPFKVLDEMVRILDIGGHIILNTPFEYWMHEEPFDYYRYTEHFFRRYADIKEDIELVSIFKIGSGREIIYDTLGKMYGGMPARLLQTICYNRKQKRKSSTQMALGFIVVYKKI